MKKVYVLLAIVSSLFLCVNTVFAVDPPKTEWEKSLGGSSGDFGGSVQQTTDGGYIVAGSTTSFGAGFYDIYLIKTDSNGDELWTQTFGGSSGDYGRSVQQTADGGYIVAGSTTSFGAGSNDVYLIKTDSNGDELWTQTFGGSSNDDGYSVQQTADGGILLLETHLVQGLMMSISSNSLV